MNIYILGAGGWIPNKNQTSCVMVECNNELILLDAGTGVANLRKYSTVLEKYDTINLIFSHYHLDHTIGLIYLDHYVRDKKLKIYGPGKMAYPYTTSYYLHELLRQEFFARCIDDFSDDVRIIDFPSHEFFIGKTKIAVKEQSHSSPSFQISVDNKLVYATDTSFDIERWKNMTSRVLLHECWDYRDGNQSSKHTSLLQLKNQMLLNKFDQIYLIHQNPDWNNEDYCKIKKMISATNIFVAQDGMELRI